jgi:predicted metal-dependent phosphoesterase TrpH
MMFYVDLHVHTRRYSPCAELLAPEVLGERMAAIGIHGLVLAEHNVLWPEEELAPLRRRLTPLKVFRGVEVSASAGHFVVIGLPAEAPIAAGMALADLAALARRHRAALIWVHPQQTAPPPTNCERDRIAGMVDAVEVASTATTDAHTPALQVLARQHRCAAVAGSDAHYPEQVGQAVTAFRRLPRSEMELAGMIRRGACRPLRLTPGIRGARHRVA